MASGQTENYGLNQWASEDAVLREEFNRDNAKINDALMNMPYVKIVSFKTEQDTNEFSMDVSQIKFEDYLRVDLFFLRTPQQNSPVSLRLNGLTENHCLVGSGIGGTSSGGNFTCDLASFGTAYHPNGWLSFFAPQPFSYVGCVYFFCSANTYGGSWCTSVVASRTVTWENLISFDFVSSSTILAGTEVILCGVKK